MEIEKTPTNEDLPTNKEHDISKQKKGRLFIKNLVFDINERMLKKLFKPFGEILEINIPLHLSTNRPQGFAFVQFDNINKAHKAINTLNKTKYKGRIVELALAVDQRLYQNLKREKKPEITEIEEKKENMEIEEIEGENKQIKEEKKKIENEKKEESSKLVEKKEPIRL